MTEKIFKTDQLALCPYLQMNGIKYIRTDVHLDKNNKPKAILLFKDENGIGKDLEINFRFSSEKIYRDLGYFFRNEIEKSIRKFKNKGE